MVNFVAATHPKGQKRCRRGDACQITSFNIKNSGLRPEFLYIVGSVELGRFLNGKGKEELQMMGKVNRYLGRAYEVLLEISGSERKRLAYEARKKATLDHNYLMPDQSGGRISGRPCVWISGRSYVWSDGRTCLGEGYATPFFRRKKCAGDCEGAGGVSGRGAKDHRVKRRTEKRTKDLYLRPF